MENLKKQINQFFTVILVLAFVSVSQLKADPEKPETIVYKSIDKVQRIIEVWKMLDLFVANNPQNGSLVILRADVGTNQNDKTFLNGDHLFWVMPEADGKNPEFYELTVDAFKINDLTSHYADRPKDGNAENTILSEKLRYIAVSVKYSARLAEKKLLLIFGKGQVVIQDELTRKTISTFKQSTKKERDSMIKRMSPFELSKAPKILTENSIFDPDANNIQLDRQLPIDADLLKLDPYSKVIFNVDAAGDETLSEFEDIKTITFINDIENTGKYESELSPKNIYIIVTYKNGTTQEIQQDPRNLPNDPLRFTLANKTHLSVDWQSTLAKIYSEHRFLGNPTEVDLAYTHVRQHTLDYRNTAGGGLFKELPVMVNIHNFQLLKIDFHPGGVEPKLPNTPIANFLNHPHPDVSDARTRSGGNQCLSLFN